jgi:hypothetical protein
MPHLHPDHPRIPPHLYSEAEVLGALRTLPPDTHVFVRLQLLDQETNSDRELDFLVVHPDLGLVIIEVKGRGVEPREDHWIRRGPDGRETVLEETPGEQLTAQQYSLLKTLKRAGLGFVPEITRVLAVPYLPLANEASLGPDLPACRILTREKLKAPFLALRNAVTGGQDWETWKRSEQGRHHSVRPDVMRALKEALLPQLLPPASLADLLAAEGRLQDEASQRLLHHLAHNFSRGRYHVSGAPGSGKSLLARQVTRLWVAEGRKVLVIAFNKALIHATQNALDDLLLDQRVDVSTYHDLAVNLLWDAHCLPGCLDETDYYNRLLPAALKALIPSLEPRWDALVVDEAQDLDPAWVLPLFSLLKHPDQDPVLLLEDPAQGLYREAHHALGQPWCLDLSLRQNPAIRRAACLAHPACGWEAPAPGTADDSVTFQPSHPKTWKRDLAECLGTLAKEGLEPHQVLILATHRPETLGFHDNQVCGPWPLNTVRDWWLEEKANHVRIGTVYAFKGLEADAVIYLAPAYHHADGPRLAYTAYSRARHRLIVLEKAIALPERPKVPEPVLPKKPIPVQVPQVKTFSEGQRQALMGALTAANHWQIRPKKAEPCLVEETP